ncbi:MAG: TIGR00341 family protein [Pseudomonadota bacterium]
MREIEIHLRDADRDLVTRVIKSIDPIDWAVFPVEQQDRVVIRVIIRAGRSQLLIDGIQAALETCADWRVSVIPVEATLPEPEPLPDDKKRESLEILREELLDDVTKDAALTQDYLILASLSAIVAAIGLNSDGVAAVIGAMVIAPLLGPILGFSLAVGLGKFDLLRQSAITLLAGLGVALATAFGLSFFVELDLGSRELMSRTEVRLDSVALALAAGGAAALSMAQGKAAALVGVMVAAALLPPGAALGLFMGAGEWTLAMRSGLLLLLNVVCLVLSAQVIFRFKRIRPRGWIERKNASRAMWINAGVSLFFLLVFTVLILFLDLGAEVKFPGDE